jgi:hypothetical protein
MSTQPLLCSRCQKSPRLPRQRWCRQCLTSAQRQRRRAARQETLADEATAPVTHAPLQTMPRVPQGAAGASTGVTHAQGQALAAYWHAVQEYETRRTIKPGWLPMDRSTILVPLALRVEYARQRLVVLGLNPEALEGR